LNKADLAFDVLDAGQRMAREAGVPMVIVNEPILISKGQNSDVRYNFFYPRWAYDQYRDMLRAHAETAGWRYVDAWDAVPQEEFTNSAVHLTPAGSRMLAEIVVATSVATTPPGPTR
jgi:beta-galactosidase GanA